MQRAEFEPVTPGDILKEEFLAEYNLSQGALARAVGVSPNRIAEIINNRRRITADTALRLSLYQIYREGLLWSACSPVDGHAGIQDGR